MAQLRWYLLQEALPDHIQASKGLCVSLHPCPDYMHFVVWVGAPVP